MSLFVCENKECQSIENTACSHFWLRGDKPALCSACDPTIGKWHDIFPRVRYDGTQTVQWADGVWIEDT